MRRAFNPRDELMPLLGENEMVFLRKVTTYCFHLKCRFLCLWDLDTY